MENVINLGDTVLVHIRKDVGYSSESYRGVFEEVQEGKKGTMLLLRIVDKEGNQVMREKDNSPMYRSLPRVSIKATRRNGRFVSCDVE
jgi:hypothetical protein